MDSLHDLTLLGLIAAAALLFAYRYGFFSIGSRVERKGSLLATAFAFLILLTLKILVDTVALGLTSFQDTESTLQFYGWTNIFGNLLPLFGLIFYSKYLLDNNLDVWGQTKIRHFYVGAISWFVAYPCALFVASTLKVIVNQWVSDTSGIDQVAVAELQKLKPFPLLYYATGLSIFLVIPVIEELLFRGFIQSAIVFHLGRWKGIFISSLIFALFHYSPEQSYANIEMLTALFILGGFMGYLYERQNSLLAPIGLHSTFNAVSFLLLSLDK